MVVETDILVVKSRVDNYIIYALILFDYIYI